MAVRPVPNDRAGSCEGVVVEVEPRVVRLGYPSSPLELMPQQRQPPSLTNAAAGLGDARDEAAHGGADHDRPGGGELVVADGVGVAEPELADVVVAPALHGPVVEACASEAAARGDRQRRLAGDERDDAVGAREPW